MRNYWLNRNHVFRFYQPDREKRYDFLRSLEDWNQGTYARHTTHFAKLPFVRPSEPIFIDRWFDDDGRIIVLVPAESAERFNEYISGYCWSLGEPDENGFRQVLESVWA